MFINKIKTITKNIINDARSNYEYIKIANGLDEY